MNYFSSAAGHRLAAIIVTVALCGCSATLSRIGIGGGNDSAKGTSNAVATGDVQTTEANSDGQVDVRRYYGSGYCPKIEIRDGTEAVRKFAKPKEPSPDTIIWQASIGETARQCQDDPNGTMSIKVGVSGRVLVGPKGSPGEISVPIRIAVVKYQEAVLASELYKETVTIGPDLSTVFRRVYTIEVPSPGNDKDYIVYVGFDNDKKKN